MTPGEVTPESRFSPDRTGEPIVVQSNVVVSANESLARRINKEARQDSFSPIAGKLMGIAQGQVVVVADWWDACSL